MSIAEFCVKRPVFTTMLVTLFVVTGIVSVRDLTVDLLPKADPATVQVSMQLPGASPDELSSSVVEPTEKALSSIAGIDEMNATVREGDVRGLVLDPVLVVEMLVPRQAEHLPVEVLRRLDVVHRDADVVDARDLHQGVVPSGYGA